MKVNDHMFCFNQHSAYSVSCLQLLHQNLSVIWLTKWLF